MSGFGEGGILRDLGLIRKKSKRVRGENQVNYLNKNQKQLLIKYYVVNFTFRYTGVSTYSKQKMPAWYRIDPDEMVTTILSLYQSHHFSL